MEGATVAYSDNEVLSRRMTRLALKKVFIQIRPFMVHILSHFCRLYRRSKIERGGPGVQTPRSRYNLALIRRYAGFVQSRSFGRLVLQTTRTAGPTLLHLWSQRMKIHLSSRWLTDVQSCSVISKMSSSAEQSCFFGEFVLSSVVMEDGGSNLSSVADRCLPSKTSY